MSSDDELRESYARLQQRKVEGYFRQVSRGENKDLVRLNECGRRAGQRPEFLHLEKKSRLYTKHFGDEAYAHRIRRVSHQISEAQKELVKFRKERKERPASARRSEKSTAIRRRRTYLNSSAKLPQVRPATAFHLRSSHTPLKNANCEALRRIAATGTSNAVSELAELINELNSDDLNTSLDELDAYQKGLELAARCGCRPLSAPGIRTSSSLLLSRNK